VHRQRPRRWLLPFPELDSIRAWQSRCACSRRGPGDGRMGRRIRVPDVTSEYRFVALDQSDRYAIDVPPFIGRNTLSAAQFARSPSKNTSNAQPRCMRNSTGAIDTHRPWRDLR